MTIAEIINGLEQILKNGECISESLVLESAIELLRQRADEEVDE